MSVTRNDLQLRIQLANRIYDLDAEVYRCSGSTLGRVLTGERQKTINELARMLGNRTMSHYLRSEIALIGNMARSVQNKAERSRLMSEYNAVLQAVAAVPTSFGTIDILDEDIANLNSASILGRFSKDQHLIICISRTYGCGGTDIGFALADSLKISYYDTEIFTEVLERLEAKKDSSIDHDSFAHDQDLNMTGNSNAGMSLRDRLREFNRYHGLSQRDAIFFNQSDLLCEMAKKEDFIIMGRCADQILTNNHIPHISIFITAPFEQRVKRTMITDNLDERRTRRLLKKLDREHGKYYNFFTGRQWGNATSYDLCINSSSYGIDGSVAVIRRLVDRAYKRKSQESE